MTEQGLRLGGKVVGMKEKENKRQEGKPRGLMEREEYVSIIEYPSLTPPHTHTHTHTHTHLPQMIFILDELL